MKERWKPIKGYEGYYSISNFGNIRNDKTKKLMYGDTNNIGYKRIILYTPVRKRYFIHRLVAYHFVKGYDSELVVNHKDGNKLNNCANNLEWVTRSQNDLHAYRLKLRGVHVAGHTGDRWYQVFDFSTGQVFGEYDRAGQLYEQYNLTKTTLQRACVRGWFYIDCRKRTKGKIGIRRIFTENNIKCVTTNETVSENKSEENGVV